VSGHVAAALLLALGAIVLAALVAAVARSLPLAPARRTPRRPPEPPPLGQLDSVARALREARASSFELHDRLVPIARQIAAARLARNHGIDLDRQPRAARALLGEAAWPLVAAAGTEPASRLEPGASEAQLRALVDALEAL
jgi:hypothetical protein